MVINGLGVTNRVEDIRETFRQLADDTTLPEDAMIEIVNASFIADQPTIFGEPNHDWHAREFQWYVSQSRFVKDIPEPIPKIWQDVASTNGEINSNYGWCILSQENGDQYLNAINAIVKDPDTRQAVMIYTRPSMHFDSHRDGMKDFICTNTVQLLYRGDQLHYMVNMRSNDAIFGYKGDRSWHTAVHDWACVDLSDRFGREVKKGHLIWNAASLHIYPRHRGLIV
jgi:thymidylate synthase